MNTNSLAFSNANGFRVMYSKLLTTLQIMHTFKDFQCTLKAIFIHVDFECLLHSDSFGNIEDMLLV